MIADFYLRAADRPALDAALAAAGLIDAEGFPATAEVAISRIGVIRQPTGDVDGEGLPIMEDLPGYHANLRLLRAATEAELAALEAVTLPAPATPYRIWFD